MPTTKPVLSVQRRSALCVQDGRVQRKNHWGRDARDYYWRRQRELVIDRRRPGEGYRHLLTVQDVRDFIGLIPDWEELSEGLEAVVLSEGIDGWDGYHVRGVVHLCAWERELWRTIGDEWHAAHATLFDRLGLERETLENGDVLCRWTAGQARAYLLIHVLMHELGHHHDRITSRRRRRADRGEPYAEGFALAREDVIWDRYCRHFGRW